MKAFSKVQEWWAEVRELWRIARLIRRLDAASRRWLRWQDELDRRGVGMLDEEWTRDDACAFAETVRSRDAAADEIEAIEAELDSLLSAERRAA